VTGRRHRSRATFRDSWNLQGPEWMIV